MAARRSGIRDDRVQGDLPSQTPPVERASTAWALFGAGVVLAAAVLLASLAGEILLLAAIGLVCALAIEGVARPLARWLHVPYSVAVLVVLACALALIALAAWLAAPGIVDEVQQLRRDLPEALSVLKRRIEEHRLWRALASGDSGAFAAAERGRALLARLPGVIAGTAGALVGLLVVALVAVSVAFEPQAYIDGLVRLVPKSRRPRALEVVHRVARVLRWWLIQQLLMAVIIGVATSLGLWLLGVPLPAVLGLLAAVLAFIPNIGPLLSAVPPVLLAAMRGLRPALYVVLLYLAIQAATSYVVAPILQRKLVSLPPALTIIVQLIMGILFGGLGVALGAPVTVLLIVLVQSIYVEGILGDTDGNSPSGAS